MLCRNVRVLLVLVLVLVPLAAGAQIDVFPDMPFSELVLPDAGSVLELHSDAGFLETDLSLLSLKKALPLLQVNIGGSVPMFVPNDVILDAIIRGEDLEKKSLLSITLIGDVAARVAEEGAFLYEMGGRVLLNSPKIDATLNFGETRFFVGGGFREEGIGWLSPAQREPVSRVLFGDVYIVGMSSWSEKWLILKFGGSIASPSTAPEANIALGMEFPSVLPKTWLKLAPVFSFSVQVVDGPYAYMRGQLGILLEGRKTGRAAVVYGMLDGGSRDHGGSPAA